MKILVTGGTGYIGSHTTIELIQAGHEVVIVDNLSNSSEIVTERIQKITGTKPLFIKADVSDKEQLSKVFAAHQFTSVIHFAALKSVGESVARPLAYYHNNIDGLLAVLECMEEHKVNSIIFSSSATVYGDPEEVPLKETSRTGLGITNPYGQTKFMCEQILQDSVRANPKLNVTLLRYFNPVGAHESGLIGEDPNDIPNNLMPFISQVAVGKLPKLNVFGGDYPTKDGTGVRDYIHVVDLAKGHLAALEHSPKNGEAAVYNLGTGFGYSVLEIIKAFEAAANVEIPYEIVGRRPGDVAECYADATKANQELNWKTTKTLTQMCEDVWKWQSLNPNGYSD